MELRFEPIQLTFRVQILNYYTTSLPTVYFLVTYLDTPCIGIIFQYNVDIGVHSHPNWLIW